MWSSQNPRTLIKVLDALLIVTVASITPWIEAGTFEKKSKPVIPSLDLR
jgi:hypothetical protein